MDHESQMHLDSSESSSSTVTDSSKVSKNVVARINEIAQILNIKIAYKLISEEGPPHNKTFTIKLEFGDEFFEGSAPNLKKAKEEAANLALLNTHYDIPLEKIKDAQTLPPTVKLNNLAIKLGLKVSYFLVNGNQETNIDSYGASNQAFGKAISAFDKINDTFSPMKIPVEDTKHQGFFTVKVKVDSLSFKGMAHSIQTARHAAAVKALEDMEFKALLQKNVCVKDDTLAACKDRKESLKSAISRVHEASQQFNLPLEFSVISETGEAHQKTFVISCKLGDFVTQAEGKSKKEAKTLAAEKMLNNLPKVVNSLSENVIVGALSNKKKKNKKKKKNVIKESAPDNSVIGAISDIAASILGTSGLGDSSTDKSQNGGKTDTNSGSTTAKNKLLEIGSKLNINIDFTDLLDEEDTSRSIMTLNVDPPQMCLGVGKSREQAHENAAIYGIEHLQKSGIFEKPEFTDYKQEINDLMASLNEVDARITEENIEST